MAKNSLAWEIREYFGMPQPGQKPLTTAEAERQIEAGKIPLKAGDTRKKKKKKKKNMLSM